MPQIKNALLRFRIIDRCLRNSFKPFPTKQLIREACEEELFGSIHGDNICDSTIEKDMHLMKLEHDAPIAYSRAQKGYFYTDINFTLDDAPLNEEDLKAIKFAAYTLQQFRDVDMFKQFGSAIDKIVDRVSISNGSNQEQVNEFVQFESSVSVGGGEFLTLLLGAIQHSKAVYFEYENFNSGEIKPRKVCPLLLKEYRNRWYLISNDIVKSRITTYALDRMRKLEVADEVIMKPSDFSPSNFFKYSMGISSSESAPEIILFKANNIAAKYIESQPFHSTQKMLKRGKKKCIFQLEIFVSEEFRRTILSYGGEIEITSPESLRGNIIQRLKEMREVYKV
jgi:predicted DNA-binding transcriptional regulator YafY